MGLHNATCRGKGPESGCYQFTQGRYQGQWACYHQSPSRPVRGTAQAGLPLWRNLQKLTNTCLATRKKYLSTSGKLEKLKKHQKKSRGKHNKEKYQKQIKIVQARKDKLQNLINNIKTRIEIAILKEAKKI